MRIQFLLSSIFSTVAAAGFAASAPRYWPKFSGSRVVSVLDGEWEYGLYAAASPSEYDPSWPIDPAWDSMNPSFIPKASLTPNKTNVPGCMDVVAGGAAGYLGPRGVAMYKTSFASPAPGLPVRLQFQACSFYCRIWVNGQEIGDHRAGGYVAFHLDVPGVQLSIEGANELFVLADNRFNATTAPMHTGGDFWHYVNADVTDPNQSTAPDAVDITLQLSSSQDAGSTASFGLAFDDGPSQTMSGVVSSDGQVLLKAVKVPSARLWSLTKPNLHTVAVTWRNGTVTERFGLRSFGTDKNARWTLNGVATKLWPVTAASPTDEQMDDDVALLKKGNANYVRGAHYPHDPRWMDRLDEAGIVFWSETIGPSVSLANTLDPVFMKYQMMQLEQMLDNAMNHASVMTWGWFNEGPSNEQAACAAYGQCNDYARARDPTRFTTWADDKDLSGKCYEHCTLIAFNNYPGWYNGHGVNKTISYWNGAADAVRAGTTDGTLGKPMVISETGAGGIWEWSEQANSTDDKWTLLYQSEIIGGDVDTALSNNNISGITLWHFYDFKVDNCGAKWPCTRSGGQENNTHCEYDHPPPTTFDELASKGPPNCKYIEVNSRPGGENHKGSLDFWRREKPAFIETAAKYAKANTPDK